MLVRAGSARRAAAADGLVISSDIYPGSLDVQPGRVKTQRRIQKEGGAGSQELGAMLLLAEA